MHRSATHVHSASSHRARRISKPLVVAAAFLVALVGIGPSPAEAAGINLAVPFGQRFVNSPSPTKLLPLPLATKIDPVRGLAIAGINATTFSPIKDPLLGITIFSSSEVKKLVLDTIIGVPDGTTIAFKVNALEHPDPTDFAIGGNCIGADGATTPYCVATVTFTPKSPGPKTDPISAQISITNGMAEVEASLRAAFNDQGIKGTLVNLIYPLIRSNVQTMLTDGVESALLAPVGTATGTGVAGPYTDPAVFVKRQYRDFAAGTPSSDQVAAWVKKFEANTPPTTLIDTLRRGETWHDRVGPVTRLYSAYFLRPPDTSGLEYWVGRSRGGTRLYAISSTFAASSEFTRRYGSLTDAEFVALVYENVLGRSPDAAGLSYWTKQLKAGKTRGRLMVGFSESSEYIRKQGANVATVEIWFGMLHRAPSPAELTGYSARLAGGTPATTIMGEMLASTEYRTVVLG